MLPPPPGRSTSYTNVERCLIYEAGAFVQKKQLAAEASAAHAAGCLARLLRAELSGRRRPDRSLRLLRRDPQRAKVEILKHLDGDLVIVPRPSISGERRAEIRGRAKSDSLLMNQEALAFRFEVTA